MHGLLGSATTTTHCSRFSVPYCLQAHCTMSQASVSDLKMVDVPLLHRVGTLEDERIQSTKGMENYIFFSFNFLSKNKTLIFPTKFCISVQLSESGTKKGVTFFRVCKNLAQSFCSFKLSPFGICKGRKVFSCIVSTLRDRCLCCIRIKVSFLYFGKEKV